MYISAFWLDHINIKTKNKHNYLPILMPPLELPLIKFMNCHDSGQTSGEELLILGSLENSLLARWRDVLHVACDNEGKVKADSPPVDLYLISEKSIWKNLVRRTGFLVYFELDFYCLCSLYQFRRGL